MHSHKTHLHYLLRNEEKSCDTSHYKADDVTLSAVNNTATDLTADLISSNEKAESLFFPDVSSSFFEEFQRDDEDKDCSLSNTADDFPFDAGKNTVDQAAEIFSSNDMAKYSFQMNFLPPTGKMCCIQISKNLILKKAYFLPHRPTIRGIPENHSRSSERRIRI